MARPWPVRPVPLLQFGTTFPTATSAHRMPRIRLAYQFGPGNHGLGEPGLHHPLLAMLAAVQAEGSISGAARRLDLSYRHVWGS